MSIASTPPPALRHTAPLAQARDHLRAVPPLRPDAAPAGRRAAAVPPRPRCPPW